MTILDKLSTYYAKSNQLGYIPSTISVSNEEYDEYLKLLADTAEDCQLVWSEKITKLSFKGIELRKYGKKHKDEKLQR